MKEMSILVKLYTYVGPDDIRRRVSGSARGVRINSREDLKQWISQSDLSSPLTATFVIDDSGGLLLADRRSEHLACAGGGPVLSAGEITFDLSDLLVLEITNQSTGFCPEPESWPAVAEALDGIGLDHPNGFTTNIVFRRCTNCGERNIVKDMWYFCEVCGQELPIQWNFDSP